MMMRVLAAVAVLVSGYVHLKLWFDGTRHIDVIGPLFLVNVAAAVVIAALLVLWRHWVPLLLAVGFGASTLGAFIVSASVGLFGLHESWEGPYVWAAAVAEVVAVVAGVLAARQEGLLSPRQRQDPVAVRGSHLD
jgi:hypothetical protein